MNGAQSINLVHVYDDTVVNTIMPVHSFPTLYETSGELMRLFNALTVEQQAAVLAMGPEERIAYAERVRAGL